MGRFRSVPGVPQVWCSTTWTFLEDLDPGPVHGQGSARQPDGLEADRVAIRRGGNDVPDIGGGIPREAVAQRQDAHVARRRIGLGENNGGGEEEGEAGRGADGWQEHAGRIA